MSYGVAPADINDQPDPIGSRLICLLDDTPPLAREKQRMTALRQLKLLDPGPVPLFEEAAQMSSRLLAAPICLLSVFDQNSQIFKATMGLSSLGLMNQLAAKRELPNSESFGLHVLHSGQSLMLSNVSQHLAFSHSLLAQKYGVQAYLGVPLFTSDGCCIGTLEAMDIMPRHYTPQDLALLELNARWVMSEYEKQCWLNDGMIQKTTESSSLGAFSEETIQDRIDTLRLRLISQLTQELRNPLTAITGMASMLSREIYGPLTEKQQEYADVVFNSSQNLLSLTNKIMELGALDNTPCQLSLASADIEMLAQQSLQLIEIGFGQQNFKLNLTVEPGSRIWVLDKRIVKQLLYHLILSISQASTEGSTVRLHISRKDSRLNLAIWVSNPWLGEDIPQSVIIWGRQNNMISAREPLDTAYGFDRIENLSLMEASPSLTDEPIVHDVQQELGLLLSQQLTDLHGGQITIQGSQTNGHRYVVSLPAFETN